MKLALFDLDHTLLPLDSDYSWGVFTMQMGWSEQASFSQRNDEFYAHYEAGTLDIYEYVRFSTRATRERGQAQAQQAHARYMNEVIQPHIKPEALALVKSHQDAGDKVIIVTATNGWVTGPIAQAFGVSELIAVDLELDASGWITGEVKGTPSFREGKVIRVTQWLSQQGLDWSDVETSFYSDSINDLPLLEKVDHPVATNPDARLRQLSTERGWRILDLFQE